MINRQPLVTYDDGFAAQGARKASKEKTPTKGLDFASFMPGEIARAQEGKSSLAAPRIESGGDLRQKRPTLRSQTAPLTGRNDLAMLPGRPNMAMAGATAKAAGGHSTMTARPAMETTNALALQAQGMAQDKVQQSFQGMGLAEGSKNLASHGLLSQSAGKDVFSPEVAAQLDAQLAGAKAKQAAQGAGAGVKTAKPRAEAGRVLEGSSQPLRAVNSLNELKTKQLNALEHPGVRAMRPATGGEPRIGNSPLLAGDSTQALLRAFRDLNIQIEHTPSPGVNGAAAGQSQARGLGSLAARFESGEEGIAAIGYDRHGGTSYGKYQISSRAGTMNTFIKYLDKNAPDIAKKLKTAGSANTGNRKGSMPNAWRQIAQEQPERFERLQDDFIRVSHLEPAMQAVTQSTGLGFAELSPALQEVVFSTAVQHGPNGAARILNRAMGTVDTEKLKDNSSKQEQVTAGNDLIRRIYSIRSTQFGSSTLQVQASVKSRLKQEMNAALEMLKA